jgi:hypothetical protein
MNRSAPTARQRWQEPASPAGDQQAWRLKCHSAPQSKVVALAPPAVQIAQGPWLRTARRTPALSYAVGVVGD